MCPCVGMGEKVPRTYLYVFLLSERAGSCLWSCAPRRPSDPITRHCTSRRIQSDDETTKHPTAACTCYLLDSSPVPTARLSLVHLQRTLSDGHARAPHSGEVLPSGHAPKVLARRPRPVAVVVAAVAAMAGSSVVVGFEAEQGGGSGRGNAGG